VWKLWLNVLLRPTMTVLGFVGAILVFNAFASYITDTLLYIVAASRPVGVKQGFFASIFSAVLYVFIMYSAANSIFKLLDLIPAGLQRWIGGPTDHSFDHGDEKGIMLAVSQQLAGFQGGALMDRKGMKGLGKMFGPKKSTGAE
jgi:hypothetical protein